MEELLKAIEAAIRRIVQEELAKKPNDFDFGEYIDRNADKFDRAVMDGLANSYEFTRLLEEKLDGTQKEAVVAIIDNYDFDDKIDQRIEKFDYSDKLTEAAKNLSFTVTVDE